VRDGRGDLLTFDLGSQRCALVLADVVEVVRVVAMAHLPDAPPLVEGIVNLRGEVVPVFDLRARFGLAPKAVELSDHLLIARAGPRTVAIRVDCARALVEVDPRDIDRPVTSGNALAGVAKLADGLALIHDLATFLSASEAQALDTALVAADRGR
jgi:purine-binding chemotaxis protein CheW